MSAATLGCSNAVVVPLCDTVRSHLADYMKPQSGVDYKTQAPLTQTSFVTSTVCRSTKIIGESATATRL